MRYILDKYWPWFQHQAPKSFGKSYDATFWLNDKSTSSECKVGLLTYHVYRIVYLLFQHNLVTRGQEKARKLRNPEGESKTNYELVYDAKSLEAMGEDEKVTRRFLLRPHEYLKSHLPYRLDDGGLERVYWRDEDLTLEANLMLDHEVVQELKVGRIFKQSVKIDPSATNVNWHLQQVNWHPKAQYSGAEELAGEIFINE